MGFGYLSRARKEILGLTGKLNRPVGPCETAVRDEFDKTSQGSGAVAPMGFDIEIEARQCLPLRGRIR